MLRWSRTSNLPWTGVDWIITRSTSIPFPDAKATPTTYLDGTTDVGVVYAAQVALMGGRLIIIASPESTGVGRTVWGGVWSGIWGGVN
jgi:hypothetical protein